MPTDTTTCDAGLPFYRVPAARRPALRCPVADLVESRTADRLLACDCWPQAACLDRDV